MPLNAQVSVQVVTAKLNLLDMTPAATEEYLQKLDLDYIEQKLCSSWYELSIWPADLAKTACQLYKDFLWLNYCYPNKQLVPTKDIDEVWHQHILHTKEYIYDCQQIFGRYFHHRPANPQNEDEIEQLGKLFAETKQLYQKTYGRPLLVLVREISAA